MESDNPSPAEQIRTIVSYGDTLFEDEYEASTVEGPGGCLALLCEREGEDYEYCNGPNPYRMK